MIVAGKVRVASETVTKAGYGVAPSVELSVEEKPRYVSRAGEKLAGALEHFGIDPSGKDCLDAGASSGGFTDALLQAGAARVTSVDVGYGQLDWKIRTDERVAVMERTNIRKLSGEDLPFAPRLLVSDLSFISLSVALDLILSTTLSITEALLLVKPQFEAGPQQVGRGGLVRDPEVHVGVITGVISDMAGHGLVAVGLVRSSVVGKKSGNQEYVLHLVRDEVTTELDIAAVRSVVAGTGVGDE